MGDVDARALAADMAVMGDTGSGDGAGARSAPADEREAARLMKDLRDVRRDQARTLAPFRDEIEMLIAARDDIGAGYTKRIDELEGLLCGWHDAVRATEPARATIKLPYGTLNSTKTPGRVVFDDRAAFLLWSADGNEDYAEVKTTTVPVSAAVLRKMSTVTDDGVVLTPAGEKVPGVHVKGAGYSVTFEVAP